MFFARLLIFVLLSPVLFPAALALAQELQPLLTYVAEKDERHEAEGRKLVVVYYGNDIEAPQMADPNNQNISAFLRKIEKASADDSLTASQKARLGKVAKIVNKRYSDIIDQSHQDISLLQQAARKKNFVLATIRNNGNSKQVSNSEPRRHLFRTIDWQHGPYAVDEATTTADAFKRELIRIPFDLGDARFQFAPLNHPAVFRETILQITDRFPADEYCYVLIVRTPTTGDSMLTGILTADVKNLEALTMAQVVLGAVEATEVSEQNSEQIATRVNQAIVDKFLTPEIQRLRATYERKLMDRFDEEYTRVVMQTNEFGTTKGEFLRILNEFGSYPNKFFPLVIVAGHRSRLEYSSDAELKDILTQSSGNHEAFHMSHVNSLFFQGSPPFNVTAAIKKAVEDESLDFAWALRRQLMRSNQ